MKHSNNNIKRFIIFISGLLLAGTGVALSTHPGLGTAPITSLPYVVTFAVPLTLGTVAVIFNLLFIVAQIVILKKFQYSLLW